MRRTQVIILLILFYAAAWSIPAFAQDGKPLIVYYSRSGNTRAACEALGKALNADIREIKDRNSRDGGLGIIGAMLKINLGMQTDTEPEKIDFSPYKTIIVSAPVWASKPGLAMKTFIENNRFDGKSVIVFMTSDSFMEEKYQEKHRQLVRNSGGTVAGYFQVQACDMVDKEKVPRTKETIVAETLKLVPDMQKALAKQ
jgi:flavodoxin